jgi:hypothetical protein
MRMTTDRIPATNALAKEIAIPLGVIVKPYGDPPTVSDFDMMTRLGRGNTCSKFWVETYRKMQRLQRLCESIHKVHREWYEMDMQPLW